MRTGVALALVVLACDPTTPPDDAGDVGMDAGRDAGRDAGLDAACPPADGSTLLPDGGLLSPTCCSAALCADVAMTCNPASCRCEPVPCSAEGPTCATLLPLVSGDVVCSTLGGGTCYARTGSYATAAEECPAGIPFCTDAPEGCLCGVGCRPFLDDCDAGLRCLLDLGPAGEVETQVIGYCRAAYGSLPAGRACETSERCAEGLACRPLDAVNAVCVAVDCGLMEGAPSCPADQRCLALDPRGLIGTCVTPCDVWDLGPTCPSGEHCVERELGWGICAPGVDSRASRGQACDEGCGPGLDCVQWTCMERCDPDAVDPSSSAACSGGEECISVPDGEHLVCADACDLFAAEETCAGGEHCEPGCSSCGGFGHCLPGAEWHREGDDCGDGCQTLGLVCASGRCRRLCRTPSEARGCLEGERCFSVPNPCDPLQLAGYGFCARPCAPSGTDCPRGVWCEPRELDPATGTWIGVCDE